MPVLFGLYRKSFYFCTRFKREAPTQILRQNTPDFSEKKINETFGGSVFSSIFVTLSQIRKPSLRSPRLFFRKRLLNEANKAFFEDIE